MKSLTLFFLFFLTLSLHLAAQTLQPPIKKQVSLEYSKQTQKIREMEFYWAGWNFVEQRDVYRLKTPKDTLFFYTGNDSKGQEKYEVVLRGGTPGSPPDNYFIAQIRTKIANSLSASMSESDESLNHYKCLLKVMAQYPLLWCDPDLYPYRKNVDEHYINKQWEQLAKKDGEAIRNIAKIMDILPGSTPTYEEKAVIYEYLKQFHEVQFTKSGKKYDFTIHTQLKEEGVFHAYKISGRITPDGVISESGREKIVPVECIAK